MAKRSDDLEAVWTPLTELHPHPRNYRTHPQDQIEHLVRSLEQFGFYRNVVACSDGTILAGHGIVLAARQAGLDSAPVVRLPLRPDDPAALKLLAADNYLSHLAINDDRSLTELLKEVQSLDDLLGTGFDEMRLAALAMVTRSADELADLDAAAEWVGMPEFRSAKAGPRIVIEFDDNDARNRFMAQLVSTLFVSKRVGDLWSCRWTEDPLAKSRQDLASLKFEG